MQSLNKSATIVGARVRPDVVEILRARAQAEGLCISAYVSTLLTLLSEADQALIKKLFQQSAELTEQLNKAVAAYNLLFRQKTELAERIMNDGLAIRTSLESMRRERQRLETAQGKARNAKFGMS